MPMAGLAVTGATGGVGGRVARRLAGRGVAQRLVVRDPSRAPAVAGAEVVEKIRAFRASVLREAGRPEDELAGRRSLHAVPDPDQ